MYAPAKKAAAFFQECVLYLELADASYNLAYSRTRVLAYSRLSAFGSGSPVSSFFCRSYGPPGKRERKWRTGNVAENLFDEPAIFGYITCQWLRE